MEMVFSAGSAVRLYNEASRPTEIVLRESLEMAVKDN
jgi:hypothetical protein